MLLFFSHLFLFHHISIRPLLIMVVIYGHELLPLRRMGEPSQSRQVEAALVNDVFVYAGGGTILIVPKVTRGHPSTI